MRIINYLVAITLVLSSVALAKLPPPTPEEQAATEARKAKEKEQLEKEKAALEKAQDRVVARYRKEGGAAQASSGGRTADENMPKTTSELPRGVGPRPERPPSGEAHSAPAK